MALYLELSVVPGSRKNEIRILPEGLKVNLTSPPVDGKANQALIALISKELGLPKKNVIIQRGLRSRKKLLAIEADTLPEPYLSLVKKSPGRKI